MRPWCSTVARLIANQKAEGAKPSTCFIPVVSGLKYGLRTVTPVSSEQLGAIPRRRILQD